MESVEIRGNKSLNDLSREALWFALHTVIAVLVLFLVVAAIALLHADPESSTPKILCTGLAFLVPLAVGAIASRIHPDNVSAYVWISGLLMFLVTCVYVLDLPTGNGLCDGCVNRPLEKLWRTFFSISNNSGLMAGDGIFVGTWIPLAMIGYAVGARLGKRAE